MRIGVKCSIMRTRADYIRMADRDKLYQLLKRNVFKARPAYNNHTSLSTILEWNYVKVQRVVISLLKTGDVEVVNGIIYPVT